MPRSSSRPWPRGVRRCAAAMHRVPARLLAAAFRPGSANRSAASRACPFTGRRAEDSTDARAVARLDRAESLIRQGSLDEAQTEARTAIAERPYEEQAWSALARAQYLAGRQRDALDTCRDLRNMLAEDLGIDPSPALADSRSRYSTRRSRGSASTNHPRHPRRTRLCGNRFRPCHSRSWGESLGAGGGGPARRTPLRIARRAGWHRQDDARAGRVAPARRGGLLGSLLRARD